MLGLKNKIENLKVKKWEEVLSLYAFPFTHICVCMPFYTYTWVSLVAQLVKNPPAMQETLVQLLGWEDSLEEGIETLSSIFAWRIPWREGPSKLHVLQPQVHGVTMSQTWLSD